MVGDEPILKSDVEYQKLRLLSEGQPINGKPDCFIPEQLAIQKLFLNQAKIDSITVDDAQVNRYVELWLENVISQVGGRDKLEEYFGKKISQIKEDERQQAKNGEIVRAMQQKIAQSVQVSPSEIRAFYEKLPADSLPYIPEAVEVQIITKKPEVALSEVDRIKDTLREYADDVNQGKRDFTTLARLYSEDQKTAARGGEYGYVSKASLDPDFAQAVFALSGDRLSPIIKTDEGYHLVQLIDKKGDMVNFRQILMRPKIEDSAITKASGQLDSLKTMIDDGKLSFGEAAEFFSDDKDTRNNIGLMLNKKADSQFEGTPSFRYEDLPQDVARVASKLKPGERSQPFLIRNSDGSEEMAIIQIKAIHPGHAANMNDDFTLIKQMATAEKRNKVIDDWIRKQQKKTFIEINEHYKDCDFQYPDWIHDNN